MYRRIFQLLAVAVAVLVVDLPSADAFGRFRAQVPEQSRVVQRPVSRKIGQPHAGHSSRGRYRLMFPLRDGGRLSRWGLSPAPKLMPK